LQERILEIDRKKV